MFRAAIGEKLVDAFMEGQCVLSEGCSSKDDCNLGNRGMWSFSGLRKLVELLAGFTHDMRT
jgi:hypothetical protein